MDKYHVGIDLAKGDDLGCCVIKKGATLLVEFFGPRCEEQALQWLLTRMDATDAGLAAAQRELAAWQKAVDDYNDPLVQHIAAAWWIKNRVAELLAQEGVPAQPQYREPTLEDARMFWELYVRAEISPESADSDTQEIFKQLGFVRKVQP